MKFRWLFLFLMLPSACRPATQEEQWYQVLRDQRIGEEQHAIVTPAGGQSHTEKTIVLGQGAWMKTARMIVQPKNKVGTSNAHFNFPPLQPGEKLRGEDLRKNQNPSVTQLLVKQSDFVVEQANNLDQFQGVDAIRSGCELAQIIHRWEAPASLSSAQALMRRAIVLWPDWKTFTMSSGHELARCIPVLTQIRVSCGDTNALMEYAAWIKAADEEKVDQYAVEAFEPLWRNPTDPIVKSISEWLFTDSASPWSKLPWKRSAFKDPLDSELVKLPAFRHLLAREMENKMVVGSMEWHSGNGINIRYNLPKANGGFHFIWPEAESPADGTKIEIRRCDWIIWKLSNSKQIPFFNPFEPIENRDQAIRKVRLEFEKPQ